MVLSRLKLVSIISYIFVMASAGLAEARPTVFVSIVPQKYFVQQIGGDRVDVQVMVQPGASPATYEPKPRQMAAVSKAKVYFAIGVGFEKAWLPRISAANGAMRVVSTDHGIEKVAMAAHDHHDEHDDDAGHDDHAGHDGHDGHEDHDRHDGDHHKDGGTPDPHIWLSPPLVKKQARTILTALKEMDPSNSQYYSDNFNQFAARIDQLDDQLTSMLSGMQGRQFMVFHPSWGYFARNYGMIQVAVEIQGKAAKPAQLKGLIKQARDAGIKVVFVQPQFSKKSAQLIAREIKGQVMVADPLAEDWMGNLLQVAEKIKAAAR